MAALSLNLAHKHREEVLDYMHLADVETIPMEVFDTALEDVYVTLKKDTLPRVMRKAVFKSWEKDWIKRNSRRSYFTNM